MIYDRDDLDEMPLDVLYHLASAKGLLDDLDDDDDAPDREVLVGMILDAQNEDLESEVEECERREAQEAADDHMRMLNERDGSDDQ